MNPHRSNVGYAVPCGVFQADRQAALQLEADRKEFVRAAIMTNNFIKGDRDPLNGLSPAMIEKFLEHAEIDPLDPLEVGQAEYSLNGAAA